MKEIELTTYKPKIFDDPEYCEEDTTKLIDVCHCEFRYINREGKIACRLFGGLRKRSRFPYILIKHKECKQHYKASKENFTIIMDRKGEMVLNQDHELPYIDNEAVSIEFNGKSIKLSDND